MKIEGKEYRTIWFENNVVKIIDQTKLPHQFTIKNLKTIKEAINAIRSDKIDIIIDLMGITSNHRLALFKNRLAKKQLVWCGYCNTTGIDEMDYLISDKNLILQNGRD